MYRNMRDFSFALIVIQVSLLLSACSNDDPTPVEPTLTANDTVNFKVELNLPNQSISFNSTARTGYVSNSSYKTGFRRYKTPFGIISINPYLELIDQQTNESIEIGSKTNFASSPSAFDELNPLTCNEHDSLSSIYIKTGNQFLCNTFSSEYECEIEESSTPFFYVKYFKANSIQRYYSSAGPQSDGTYFKVNKVDKIKFSAPPGILTLIKGEFKIDLYQYYSDTIALDQITTDTSYFEISAWLYDSSECTE